MADAQRAILPPAFGQAGFLAAFRLVAEKDLAGDSEYLLIGKPRQQRREEIGFDAHIGIEQSHNIVFGRTETGIRAAAEAQIFRQSQNADLRVIQTNPFGASIGRSVIHDDNFAPRMVFDCRDPRRKKTLQQLPAIPVGDDKRGGVCPRLCVARKPAPANEQPKKIRESDRYGAEGGDHG